MMKTPLATETDGAAAFSKIPTSTSGNQLYFHIPFCKKKCPYCHFFVVSDRDKAPFLDALRSELALQRDLIGSVRSIYFGGGTPSLLTPKELASIIDLPDDIEITLEANPDDLSPEYLSAIRSLGINRLSIGVQSLDDADLIQIGRIHNVSATLRALENAGRFFDNISIDLMYDLPSQNLTSWEKTLSRLNELPITHLSLYNMTIEEGTAFDRKKSSLRLPTDEESLAFHQLAIDLIPLQRYEISAFAKPGFKAVHNRGYWEGRPFFGFGPSAFSYQNRARYQNAPNLKTYIETIKKGALPISYHEKLPYAAHERELLAVALRLLAGVTLSDYTLEQETHRAIESLIQEGLLIHDKTLRLTERGTLFYDSIASTLI